MVTNEKYKDTVFRKLFNEKSKALELYNAITGNNYTKASIIELCTLDDTLYTPRKNDLAFTVEDKLILIVEHQSTINNNMPLRMLLYLAREYEKILDTSSIYKNTLIKIPTPELIVLYNGTGKQPLEKILKLSDAFKVPLEENFVELKVKLINIKYEMKNPILSKSENLRGYSLLIYKIQTYTYQGLNRDEAIKLSIKECIEENTLKEFLTENSKEVFNMLTAEFDMDTALRVQKEEGIEEGKQVGEYEKAVQIAKNMLDESIPLKVISRLTDLPIEIVQELANRDTTKNISTNPYE